jgi:hypothetical protein
MYGKAIRLQLIITYMKKHYTYINLHVSIASSFKSCMHYFNSQVNHFGESELITGEAAGTR